MTRAEAMRVPFVPESLTIISKCWLDGHDSDPPTLEVKLSDGSYLKVGYDTDYHHPLVWLATDKHADFVTAVASESSNAPSSSTSHARRPSWSTGRS